MIFSIHFLYIFRRGQSIGSLSLKTAMPCWRSALTKCIKFGWMCDYILLQKSGWSIYLFSNSFRDLFTFLHSFSLSSPDIACLRVILWTLPCGCREILRLPPLVHCNNADSNSWCPPRPVTSSFEGCGFLILNSVVWTELMTCELLI